MEPRLVELKQLHLVGLPFYGDPANGNFTKAWDRFMHVDLPTQGRVNPKIFYGVEIYGPEMMDTHQWHYFTACEMDSVTPPPGILFAKTLPASLYAVFQVTGGISKLSETFHYAYDQWLRNSDYKIAFPFDFEYYGEDFNGDSPDAKIDIYLPIQPK